MTEAEQNIQEEKIYRYPRGTLRLQQYFLATMGIFLLAAFIYFLQNQDYFSHNPPANTLAILLIMIILALHSLRKTGKIRSRLKKYGIELEDHKKKVYIEYKDITEVRFSKVFKLAVGGMKVISDRQDMTIFPAFENAGDFFKSFRLILDEVGKGGVYDREKLYKVYKMASFQEQYFARGNSLIKQLLAIALSCGIISYTLSWISHQSIVVQVLWTLSGLSFPLLFSIFLDIYLIRKFFKEADEENFSVPSRDEALERKLFFKIMMVAGVLYLAINAVVFYFAL